QPRVGCRQPILDEYLSAVDVGAVLERDAKVERTVARRLRIHVDHALYAIHLLLDDGGNRVGNGLGAGAGESRADLDLRRSDLGQLGDGQTEIGERPDERDEK